MLCAWLDRVGLSIERTLHDNCCRMGMRIDAAAPSERQVAYSQRGGSAKRDGQRSYGKSLAGAVLASSFLTTVMQLLRNGGDAAPG